MGKRKKMVPANPVRLAELIGAFKGMQKAMCKMLHAEGLTWVQVESALKLRWGNGMTAWRGAGKKHRKVG